ncbi:hypothetical protein IU459_27895 [Nocardia amamiensis]|uniref:Uncharacterized protein n=1 Tax=Nocardia amamiensis TaxID=404578 RepID=A0ABS0CXX3_9NOCA|nr:hypothetical protein [Nocardia amamiensis]MBF6301335.1 hypothetical protein [Nocardia amamiensis]
MTVGIVLLLASVIVSPALLWRAIGAAIDRTVRDGLPGRYRRDADDTTPSRAPRALSDESDPSVLDAEPGWTDPARVWSALDAENALLAALLDRRINPAAFRARMVRPTRRCEPAGPATRDR